LRIIKSNTVRYEAFHTMLPSISKSRTASAAVGLLSEGYEDEFANSNNKNSNLFNKIYEFSKNLKNLNDRAILEQNFEQFLKKIISCKESAIFLFNDDQTLLISISSNLSSRIKYFANSQLEAGTLNELTKTGTHKVLLDSHVYNIDGSKSYYLIIPFSGISKSKGILMVLFSFPVNKNSFEINLVKLSLEMFLYKLGEIEKKDELKKAYNELQVYQSKLTNDFKLSAIGELTSGIVEDVLSPLQVILSSTEFLRNENSMGDESVLDTINYQVKKVKNVINRLIKFANSGDTKNKIYPCSINNIINDFYLMFNSSLKNSNYECVLDLDENIPLMLTNENYINQILTNIFHLIKAGNNKAGGIFIKTKCINEKVTVKFLSTDYFIALKKESQNNSIDINLKIVKNIMLQHEGEINYESDNNKGTIINLTFPLKRKNLR